MSHLDHLRAKRKSAAAVLLLFNRCFSETSGELYAFVEGEEDHEFYTSIIESHFPEMKVRSFPCWGKSEVETIARHISVVAEKNNRSLFFIDKDIDSLCGNISNRLFNMYETPCYAIENIVCTREAFSSGLRTFMRLPETDPIFVECMRIAEKNFHFLEDSLLPVMALAISARREKVNVVFNDFRPQDHFKFDKDGSIAVKSPLTEAFADSVSLDVRGLASLPAVLEELNRLHHSEWLRGKYLAWMFVTTFTKLWERFRGQETTTGIKIKITTQITISNYIQIFGGHFKYPACLIEFLKKMRHFISIPMGVDKITT